jgi:hypothetical protein
MAMKTTSDGGKMDNDIAIAQRRPAGPVATCLAALLSLSLGTAVGLVVPTGIPDAYAAGVAIKPNPAVGTALATRHAGGPAERGQVVRR